MTNARPSVRRALESGRFDSTFVRGARMNYTANIKNIKGREEGFIPTPLLDASMSES